MGVVRLKTGEDQALRAGRPWVYRSEIARLEGTPTTGDIVEVLDERGSFVARGFYHERSVLAIRVLTRRRDEVVDAAFFARRIQAAWDLRRRLLADATVCRVVFSEADGLPGLIADRLGDVIVVQALVAGMDERLPELVDALSRATGVDAFYERNDGAVRRLEGLEERVGALRGHPPDRVLVEEGGVRLTVDLRRGQKTGHFLDQRENRSVFGRMVRSLLVEGAPEPVRVLDAFCHTGGFGLQALAAGAGEVTFLDSSATVLASALENSRANGWEDSRVRLEEANAFDALRAHVREGRRFDAVVVDPPAFARSQRRLDGAYRGYRDLNVHALRLLRPGGLLCSCSCSQPVTEEMFERMLCDAAVDTGRQVRVLERRGAAPDHPGLLGAEETRYLKCFLLQVVA